MSSDKKELLEFGPSMGQLFPSNKEAFNPLLLSIEALVSKSKYIPNMELTAHEENVVTWLQNMPEEEQFRKMISELESACKKLTEAREEFLGGYDYSDKAFLDFLCCTVFSAYATTR